MAKRNVDYFKPPNFKDYFTLAELCREVKRDPSWIRELEKQERIPIPRRVKRGKLSIRLWSPAQVEEIKEILSTLRPGRPSAT